MPLTWFAVDPSHYPFVITGPLCACGHSRVAHVGTQVYAHNLMGLGRTSDVACSECDCEKYAPIEAIDYEAENRERDQILANEQRLRNGQTAINYGVLALLVFGVLVSIWNSDVGIRILTVAIGASAANMAFATYFQWKRGEAETIDLALNITLDVVAVFFIIGLLNDIRTLWLFSLAVLVPVICIMLLRIFRDVSQRQRQLAAWTAGLRKHFDR